MLFLFLFHFSAQGDNKKLSYSFLSEGFSLKFAFSMVWGLAALSIRLLTREMHLIIMYTDKPYAIPSVQLEFSLKARPVY